MTDVTWDDILNRLNAYDRTRRLVLGGWCLWLACACGARVKSRSPSARLRCRGCQWRDRQRAKRRATFDMLQPIVIVDEVQYLLTLRQQERDLICKTVGVPARLLDHKP